VRVQISERLLALPVLVCLLVAACIAAQKDWTFAPQIRSAKTVYFDNESGSSAVGANALAELKKWGKFQIVQDKKHADLVVLLSANPYHKGDDYASGQTGHDDGNVDHTPKWNRQKQTQYSYLTVIDPRTEDSLWSAEHVGGGLLTGFNSAGERLVKELEKQAKK
jgi:hypothetical protein